MKQRKKNCENLPTCLGAEAAVLLLLLFVDDVVHGPQSQKRDAPSPSPTLQANANATFKWNLLIMIYLTPIDFVH